MEKEYKDSKYVIEAKGEIPFAQKTNDGCEFYNNDRTTKSIVSKQQVNDTDREVHRTFFAAFCFVKEREGWVKGDNYHQTDTITEFAKELNASPYFTKAIREYRQQMEITEEWETNNIR